MSLHSACNSSRVISPPFLNSSAGMSSGPAALPFPVIAIALAISDLSGGGSLSSVSKGADSWSPYKSSQYANIGLVESRIFDQYAECKQAGPRYLYTTKD